MVQRPHVCANAAGEAKLHAEAMRLEKAALGILWCPDQRPLSDLEVLVLAEAPPPAERLRVRRLAYLARALKWGPPLLHAMLQQAHRLRTD